MKQFKIKIYLAGFTATLLSLASCTKKVDSRLITNSDFSNSSQVKIYVATVNAVRNYVYVDGKPINGAALTSGSVFPSSGIYATSISSGLRAFLVRDTLAAATQLPYSFSENMQAARNHSIFLYDTINSPKQKTVVDDYTIPADTTARIRFAHFTYSPVAVPNVDIYSKRRGANIFSNVPLTDVTSYVPIASGLPDTLIVRVAGSGTDLTNNPGPVPVQVIFTPTAKRSYTLLFRGGYRATTTSNATVRTLSVYAQ